MWCSFSGEGLSRARLKVFVQFLSKRDTISSHNFVNSCQIAIEWSCRFLEVGSSFATNSYSRKILAQKRRGASCKYYQVNREISFDIWNFVCSLCIYICPFNLLYVQPLFDIILFIARFVRDISFFLILQVFSAKFYYQYEMSKRHFRSYSDGFELIEYSRAYYVLQNLPITIARSALLTNNPHSDKFTSTGCAI